MTAQPSIFDVMADVLSAIPEPVRRELHVAEPVWRFLRDTYAQAVRPEAASAMTDMPIVVDDALSGGQWQIRENGQVVKSGDMAPAPDGMVVTYFPQAGWVAIRQDLVEMPPFQTVEETR